MSLRVCVPLKVRALAALVSASLSALLLLLTSIKDPPPMFGRPLLINLLL
jgi:hypothetical protein